MVGLGKKLFDIFERENISVEFMPMGIDDMSFIFSEDQISYAPNKINDIEKKISECIGENAQISFQEHLGSLVVSGKGLKGRKGISADIQSTLAQAEVNLRFISQGPQERCIIYGIDSSDGKKAVNAIYDKYLKE